LGIVEPAILISKSLAMKSLYSWFVYVLIGLFSIALCFFYPAIAQADYLDHYPHAQLIGSDPKATLEIYGSPGTQQPAIAKAEVGDQVRVIEQAFDNNGNRWDRIQLLKSSQVEGWISAESIKLQLLEASEQLAKVNEEEVMASMKTPIPPAEVSKKLANLEIEYRSSKLQLKNLETQIEELQGKERRFGQMKLDYERMLAELSHRKKLMTNLYQKEQETEVELSAGSAEIFKLANPSLPNHRSSPQLTKYLYGAFSMSLFVVAITSVLLMALFPRLDSEAEVHRLNLPVLGKVPLVKRFRTVQDDIPGYGLEHLKIMIYRIVRETKDLKCPVVIVSSPHAREGKSTLTHFLSIASQNPERKTLLIDGDLLTAHPNKFFGFSEDATKGL
jgi:Mrp family chromosome partitioning ATPase